MKKETKDKKSTKTSWIGKTATMAAVVAALGISLGVNVQKVYGVRRYPEFRESFKTSTKVDLRPTRQNRVSTGKN